MFHVEHLWFLEDRIEIIYFQSRRGRTAASLTTMIYCSTWNNISPQAIAQNQNVPRGTYAVNTNTPNIKNYPFARTFLFKS
jgi:hypothetical protein